MKADLIFINCMGSNLSGSTWGRMLSMQSGSSMELVWMIGSSGAWFVWSKLSPFLLPVHCKLQYCKLVLFRTDWDAGFVEGRQYGRGKTGGQVQLLRIKSLNWLFHFRWGMSTGLISTPAEGDTARSSSRSWKRQMASCEISVHFVKFLSLSIEDLSWSFKWKTFWLLDHSVRNNVDYCLNTNCVRAMAILMVRNGQPETISSVVVRVDLPTAELWEKLILMSLFM